MSAILLLNFKYTSNIVFYIVLPPPSMHQNVEVWCSVKYMVQLQMMIMLLKLENIVFHQNCTLVFQLWTIRYMEKKKILYPPHTLNIRNICDIWIMCVWHEICITVFWPIKNEIKLSTQYFFLQDVKKLYLTINFLCQLFSD